MINLVVIPIKPDFYSVYNETQWNMNIFLIVEKF